jgi:hypothetical protein
MTTPEKLPQPTTKSLKVAFTDLQQDGSRCHL